MIVMPANASGWLFHCLARETGRIGHLHSPGHQRGPWPWLPYALDNGCFSFWNPADNSFDEGKWKLSEYRWKSLLFWSQANAQKPLWAIVPDRPGAADETFRKWSEYAGIVEQSGIPLALAVQDGMTASAVRELRPVPAVICVGGTTQWKWDSAEKWAGEFERTHLLRCNSPEKLVLLEKWGFESCDGSGWNRGDRAQTSGLERWARSKPWWTFPALHDLWPHACRRERLSARQPKGQPQQETFA